MRPIHHKVAGRSWLTITWFFRRSFWMLLLLSLGFLLGLITGLSKQLDDIDVQDLIYSIVLGGLIPTSLILWIIFAIAHNRRSKKESKHYIVGYLQELKNKGSLSDENFTKEKINIYEN